MLKLPELTDAEQLLLFKAVASGDVLLVSARVSQMVRERERALIPTAPPIINLEWDIYRKHGKVNAIIAYRNRNPDISLAMAKEIWDQATASLGVLPGTGPSKGNDK